MFRLIKKDIYTQRKIAYLTPLLLLPYFLTMGKGIGSANTLVGILIFSMSIAFIAYFMTMYSNFNTGESERMQNRLMLSLPIERRTVINAKYIMISVWWLISYVSYIFIIEILKSVLRFTLNFTVDLKVTFLSFCFAYLLASIFYPINFKFGYKISSIVGLLMFFLVPSCFGKLLSVNMSFISTVSEHPILTVAIISLVVTLLSYLISERIFTKKDF